MHTSKLLQVLGKVTHYPHIEPEHFKCILQGAGGPTFEADLHKTEVKILQLLDLWKDKLTESQRLELLKLIDNYGQAKYEAGSCDESMANAGEDI